MVSGSLAGGGAERVTSTLLAHLDRERVDPALCLLRGPVAFDAPADVPITILDKDRPWHLPRTVLRLRRLIETTRPDVVLSTIAFVNLVTGAALRTLRDAPPWIARIGSPPGRADRWMTTPLRRLYASAAVLLANSRCVAEEIQRTYAPSPDRVAVCHNPTDFTAIDRAAGDACPSDPPVILSVGRLARVKRADLLLGAFARVRARRPCELWFCGDGPLRAELERRAAPIGGVRFLGYRDNPYPLMRQATLFALTSDHEGLPNALIEAQGLGLPAVATRCRCGPDEIIDDDVTGILAPTGDVGRIAGAIERILDDGALHASMAAEARRRTRERFSPAALVRRLEEILDRARCA